MFAKNKILSLLIFFCYSNGLFSQNGDQLFTAENFIDQIRLYHPVAKQANILIDKASAELLSARGGFDPTFDLYGSRKTFEGKNYFYYTNPELKIPTPIGIDLKTGIEDNGGDFLESEATRGRSSYVGIEIPLANGLMMDKRRAMLQQAKIFQNQSEQERLVIYNDLLFDAYTTYWEWTGSYQLYKIYANYVQVAARRLQLVKITFSYGDRAMSDTVEANAQLQSFRLLQSEALLELNNRSLEMSEYLWRNDGSPYLLPINFVPDTVQFEMLIPLKSIDILIEQVAESHPEIRSYQYKLQDLAVERKLNFQSLLPVANVRANLLSRDYYIYNETNPGFLENNYRLGLSIKMPLLFRQGRGEYRLTQLKIKETNLQLIDKTWLLQTKIRQYYNEALLLQDQLRISVNMNRDFNFLLKNEELRFFQGESSLFLINSRENKVLEMQQKLIELRIKYLKAEYSIDWASGIIR